jgi:galactose mutarotase-like enzyme
MGIPLLHPWANRLGGEGFPVAGADVRLDVPGIRLQRDENGLPIHGLLAGVPGWQVEERAGGSSGARLAARFDFAADTALTAAFPFPHRLELRAELTGPRLTIATTVEATAGPVPIAFGFHPYFRLPGVPRERWEVELPVRERLPLDARSLPTGAREPARIEPGPLGRRTFDDAFMAPTDGAPFVLAGGARRVEVRFERGFPYAQIYAPADDEVLAIEPMTAPTDALESGDGLRVLEPGGTLTAAFSVTVL